MELTSKKMKLKNCKRQMKNANKITTICKCDRCEQGGFFIHNRTGITECFSCPLCDFRIEEQYEYKVDDYIQSNFKYCPKCRIMFDYGCTHSLVGCEWDVWNAHIISKYKYKGQVYYGMPQFDSIEEWKECANDIEILEMKCLNDGYHCLHNYHPNKDVCDLAPNQRLTAPSLTIDFDV